MLYATPCSDIRAAFLILLSFSVVEARIRRSGIFEDGIANWLTGTGAAGRQADVAIRDDRIVEVYVDPELGRRAMLPLQRMLDFKKTL